MQFLTREEAQRAADLVQMIVAHAEAGRPVVISPADAELVALGLVVIVRLAPHAPEVAAGLG